MDAPGASVGALDAPDAPGGHRTQRGHLAHAVRSAHWARGRGACRGGRERRPGRRTALGAREPASTCAPGGLGACGQGRRAKAAAAPPLADSSSCGRWLTRRTPAGWRQSPCSVRSTLRCNAPLHDPSGRQARGGGLCGHGRGVQRVSHARFWQNALARGRRRPTARLHVREYTPLQHRGGSCAQDRARSGLATIRTHRRDERHARRGGVDGVCRRYFAGCERPLAEASV